MRILTNLTAASAIVLFSAASAVASCNPSDQPAHVGATYGSPEKDTFGFTCVRQDVAQTGSTVRRTEMRAEQIGFPSNDPEKDTFGYSQAASPR